MNDAEPTGELIDSYARWRSSRLGRITDAIEQRLLFECLGSVAGKAVLDVGCGDGALALELARRGAIVTGLDADAAMIAAARRRADSAGIRLPLVEGQAEALPFDDAAFDYVIAITVLCFVRDAGQAVGEMARVLRPGGRLLIGDLHRWSLWAAQRRIRGWFGHRTWRNVKFRSKSDLRHLAGAAGLRAVALRGAVHYPPCGAMARLFLPIDAWLGQHASLGPAFVLMRAAKP